MSRANVAFTFTILFWCIMVSDSLCAIFSGLWHSSLYTAFTSENKAFLLSGASCSKTGNSSTLAVKKLLFIFWTTWVGSKSKKLYRRSTGWLWILSTLHHRDRPFRIFCWIQHYPVKSQRHWTQHHAKEAWPFWNIDFVFLLLDFYWVYANHILVSAWKRFYHKTQCCVGNFTAICQT